MTARSTWSIQRLSEFFQSQWGLKLEELPADSEDPIVKVAGIVLEMATARELENSNWYEAPSLFDTVQLIVAKEKEVEDLKLVVETKVGLPFEQFMSGMGKLLGVEVNRADR
jgi:translation elongation factor EF-1alpha